MRRIVHVTQQAVDIAYTQKALAAAARAAPTSPPTKSKFITWSDTRTWKDPDYAPPEKGPAFSMVRQLLLTKPRTFQELLDAGLEAYAKEVAGSRPGSEVDLAASQAVSSNKAAGKNKKRASDETEGRLPPGHPFVSSSYLKKRILTVLESQDLVYKKAVRPMSGSVGADYLTAEERAYKGSPFSWFLRLPTRFKQSDPLAKWSIPEQWNRLINNEFPGTVHKEYHELKRAQARAERERAMDRGAVKRPEREIWTWEGRQPELTTRLQRGHLSRRKQKNRTKGELKRLRQRLRFEIKVAARERTAQRSVKREKLEKSNLGTQTQKAKKARAAGPAAAEPIAQ